MVKLVKKYSKWWQYIYYSNKTELQFCICESSDLNQIWSQQGSVLIALLCNEMKTQVDLADLHPFIENDADAHSPNKRWV